MGCIVLRRLQFIYFVHSTECPGKASVRVGQKRDGDIRVGVAPLRHGMIDAGSGRLRKRLHCRMYEMEGIDVLPQH
jgi:hypothetical protein